jgi:hypothetical protein
MKKLLVVLILLSMSSVAQAAPKLGIYASAEGGLRILNVQHGRSSDTIVSGDYSLLNVGFSLLFPRQELTFGFNLGEKLWHHENGSSDALEVDVRWTADLRDIGTDYRLFAGGGLTFGYRTSRNKMMGLFGGLARFGIEIGEETDAVRLRPYVYTKATLGRGEQHSRFYHIVFGAGFEVAIFPG